MLNSHLMLTKLIISPSKEVQVKKVKEILTGLEVTNPHPDLLWIEPEEEKKLGVKDAKTIQIHLSFKPYSAKGKVVVIIGADTFSLDAQNSILKTLEEPPSSASIILTASAEEGLLETIRSRCEIVKIQSENSKIQDTRYRKEIEQLLKAPLEERFQIIEKTEDREGLFQALVEYTAKELPNNPKLLEFAKEVSEAEKWAKHQGNIRTILEYLMLSW